MYIAMNRFKVKIGNEDAFETRWLNRDILLKSCLGFISFQFLRGPQNAEYTLYVSHTLWETYDDFCNWTKSDAFKEAHIKAGQSERLTISPPTFEGFDILQTVTRRVI
ncbi:antibiotic biosynthesis monooxygenase [Aristophania vespae]|uniref:Antibiotic biosynthesis monooxygenase n=1 Tax=Aristophania vespae TaxID=2697033 RepID=A0A6P1NGT4_9PROT|nr:antibiotic biosynthesis monooxygenase [Aristophania vespae]QHI96107.1 antibiotic biosynthesis monooxygenase [Aristophania vespae]UMM63876.1 Heme oxygenase (staphylobilin-producing) [Aristophania vespae]